MSVASHPHAARHPHSSTPTTTIGCPTRAMPAASNHTFSGLVWVFAVRPGATPQVPDSARVRA